MENSPNLISKTIKLPVYSPDKRVIIFELDCVVDEKLYGEISKHNWKLQYQQGLWRVFKNSSFLKKKTTYFLHNFIWTLTHGSFDTNLVVDHINNNSLDNRISNLRLISKKQNSYNTRPNKNSSSKYKGVAWDKPNSKWRSQIVFNGKKNHLGYFLDEMEAAKAYDKKAKELFGEFAYLNFTS